MDATVYRRFEIRVTENGHFLTKKSSKIIKSSWKFKSSVDCAIQRSIHFANSPKYRKLVCKPVSLGTQRSMHFANSQKYRKLVCKPVSLGTQRSIHFTSSQKYRKLVYKPVSLGTQRSIHFVNSQKYRNLVRKPVSLGTQRSIHFAHFQSKKFWERFQSKKLCHPPDFGNCLVASDLQNREGDNDLQLFP